MPGWDNFYVIAGTAAGALIGLEFVAITLIANSSRGPGSAKASAAFATPTIVHFCAVLLLAGVETVPWRGAAALNVIRGVIGFGGIAYEVLVTYRMRAQPYQPVWEDWLSHSLLPAAAYAALAAAAFSPAQAAVFITAAAVLLLLFVGIHNAWDAVIWHVFSRQRE